MNDMARLDEVWGSRPTTFDAWLVDPSGVPRTLRDLGEVLKRVRPGQIIVRRTATHPNGEMERVAAPNPAALEDYLRTQDVHVMVLDLQAVSDEYRALLDRFVGILRPVLERRKIEVVKPVVGLFLSSPGSVAQFHADPENNFLIQIAGTKELHVFPNDDAQIFPAQEREQLFVRHKHRLPYRPEFESRALVAQLGPGMSSYQPALCPHWVKAGSETCVSIGFSVFTTAERGKRRVHVFNHQVRRLGLHPRPLGESVFWDRLKTVAGGVLDGAQETAGRLRGTKS